MRDLIRRGSVAGALLALTTTGCRPEQDRGYDKAQYRVHEEVAQASHPSPPPVYPGMTFGAAQKVALKSPPAGVTQEMVDEGQKLYGQVCTACHGAGGTGSPAAPKLTDSEWIHISGQFPEIVTIVNNGVANPKQYPAAMPAKGGGNFTDEQVRQIAAYVYALSHQEGA